MKSNETAPSGMNESLTGTSIGSELTQDCSPNVLSMEAIRRDLIGIREAHGADTPIGHECSNLVEMVENFERETDPEVRARIAAGIQKKNARLAQLLAAARQ